MVGISSRAQTMVLLTTLVVLVNWQLHGVSADYDPTVYGTPFPNSVGSKRIIFPKGAVLTIKPSLEIPLLDDSEFLWKTFSSHFMFEMPVKIHLDKLGKYALSKWMYLGQEMLGNIDMSEPDVNGIGFAYLNSIFSPKSLKKRLRVNHAGAFNQTQQQQVPTEATNPYSYAYTYKSSARARARRAINSPNPPREQQQQQLPSRYDDRFHVLTKLENVLDSVGWSPGQGCLLRAICELHEYFSTAHGQYNFDGYGLVGEIALLLLSVSKTSTHTQAALKQHLDAERAGVAGNCTKYLQACSKSVFRQ